MIENYNTLPPLSLPAAFVSPKMDKVLSAPMEEDTRSHRERKEGRIWLRQNNIRKKHFRAENRIELIFIEHSWELRNPILGEVSPASLPWTYTATDYWKYKEPQLLYEWQPCNPLSSTVFHCLEASFQKRKIWDAFFFYRERASPTVVMKTPSTQVRTLTFRNCFACQSKWHRRTAD